MKIIAIGVLVALIAVVSLSLLRPNTPPTDQEQMPIAKLPPSTAAMIENKSWRVINLDGMDIGSSGITATFADGTLSGTDGCNRYTTTYTIQENMITISEQIAGTMMACEPEIMEVAQQFQTVLPKSSSFVVENDLLSLRDDSGTPLVTFRQESQELSGSSWQVTGVNNGNQALVSLAAETTITLEFSLDSQVSGNSGCNQYTGGFTEDGNLLTISTIAGTLRMCIEPEGVMEQEQQFQAALQKAATFSIENDTLTIRDANEAMQVTARRS